MSEICSWKIGREDVCVDGKVILKCILKNMVQGSETDSTGCREHKMDVRVAEKGGNS
jgi:hypothetical protein